MPNTNTSFAEVLILIVLIDTSGNVERKWFQKKKKMGVRLTFNRRRKGNEVNRTS